MTEANTTRWTVTVSKDTDIAVRSLLAQRGLKNRRGQGTRCLPGAQARDRCGRNLPAAHRGATGRDGDHALARHRPGLGLPRARRPRRDLMPVTVLTVFSSCHLLKADFGGRKHSPSLAHLPLVIGSQALAQN